MKASTLTSKSSNKNFKNNEVFVAKSKFLMKSEIDSYGLYASKSYNINDVIQEYIGIKMSLTRSSVKKSHRNYFFDVKSNGKAIYVIDSANASKSSPARYVNSIRYKDEEIYMNTKFVQHDFKIYLIAIKPIKANDELIAYYGKATEAIISM